MNAGVDGSRIAGPVMTNNRAINAVASATILACGCGLYLYFHPWPPAVDPRPQEAAGRVLAAEALKRLEPGGRLIVIARDQVPFQVPASALQLAAFESGIRAAGQSVSKTHWLKLDALRPAAVPPGDFFELLRRAQPSDLIVSFLGPPQLEPQQLAKLGGKHPRVLAVCASGTTPAELQRLFEQKLLSAAVLVRTDRTEPGLRSGPEGAFADTFTLVTPEALAAESGNPAARR
jgi:hypothetical protein